MTTPITVKPSGGLGELWRKDDWWAIWIGLAVVVASILLFQTGASLRWLAVTPPKWSSVSQVTADLADHWPRYIAQFGFWLAAFSLALGLLGFRLKHFVPAFALLYVAAYAIFIIGQWENAAAYNLEPPLIALFLGLVVANLGGLPRWLDAGFRGELYVKTGIVLLGATVPLSLIALAGPTAILQASIVSLVTFGVIYAIAVRVGLDRPFAATLGVGGAVCGVSAAIAVAAAVGAKKEDTAVTITTVVLWAIVMIFLLPFVGRLLHLPTGIAGAWIGTSEFADAAGIAAAQAYGGFAGKIDGIAGTPDQAVQAFTLIKVVGRDVWIGIWAVILAIVSTTRWETQSAGNGPDAREIWRRFPKFVIGFFLTSALVTAATSALSLEAYNKIAVPGFIAPVKDLRTWCFIFCFLSIGLTTRFRDLAAAGRRPLIAFTAGVIVNVILGYILSVHVFGAHWESLGQ
ncbi:putative sulfate exporter family transporter [Sphingomonas sp. AP4-R1]|uniref:YeiH family protein n=1 Tax=Sphingomonas sp. AP4-R1 TaxID=2735134 RepID=UPI001493D75E|nr:putative sulfate exporter family transporter [Sphingomonas sp. AP4-R1]QJU58349.1 putative sulfate exporter family transporter [Sphingomonas sp. AP4-R1]